VVCCVRVGGIAYVVGGVITSSLRSDSDGWIDTYVRERSGWSRSYVPARQGKSAMTCRFEIDSLRRRRRPCGCQVTAGGNCFLEGSG